MNVVLHPVAEGRCPCCGRTKPQWTPSAIIAAMQKWARVHGMAPSKRDWIRADVDHPAYETVYEVFGSIGVARAAAGLTRPYRSVTHCSRGHEFTAANTYLHRGKRLCRICRTDQMRQWRERTAA